MWKQRHVRVVADYGRGLPNAPSRLSPRGKPGRGSIENARGGASPYSLNPPGPTPMTARRFDSTLAGRSASCLSDFRQLVAGIALCNLAR